ncbi:MAG: ribokinase [Oscillospiraceae bacterium]|nr:ribokinase [Oscillospiraceae bacterium]
MILNIGSLNIDYVYSVDHFVRAGETIASRELHTFCGGKGLNQSVACARAGAKIRHLGRVGGEGLFLRERLEQAGVDVSDVTVLRDVASGHAIIQVDTSGQNSIVLYAGANHRITEADVDAAVARCARGDILLLQNETSCVDYAAEAAHAAGMRVALNPSPITDALARSRALAHVDWFILNEIEGEAVSGEKEPEKICDALLGRYPDARVMLTLGARGCLYKDAQTTARHDIYKVPVVDTTAAGDTFTGYFLAGLERGADIGAILAEASMASSIAVGRAGASDSIPVYGEVAAALAGQK